MAAVDTVLNCKVWYRKSLNTSRTLNTDLGFDFIVLIEVGEGTFIFKVTVSCRASLVSKDITKNLF